MYMSPSREAQPMPVIPPLSLLCRLPTTKDASGRRRPGDYWSVGTGQALRHWLLPSLSPDPSSSRPPLPGTAAKPALALLCSPAAPTSTLRLHQQGELAFHSPKSLNKKSRKQPRSTGLPQVRSFSQVRSQPTQHLTARGGCPVRSAFSWLRFPLILFN
jgi:hypothetical protein